MSFFLSTGPSDLLAFMLEVVLKGSVVLAVAGLATSLLRKSPAAVRHTIWTSALVMVMILPAIVAYAPSVDVGVLPVETLQVTTVPVETGIQLRPGARSAASRRERRAAHIESPPHRRRQESQFAMSARAGGPVEIARSESPAPKSGFDWKLGLLGIWAAGIVVIFFRYVAGWIALMRIKRRSEPVADIRFRLAAIKVARSMGLTRRVRFVWGDSGGMPLTWGWIRPTVLLPQDAREWEPEKILSVLRHELAHVKRYDCFVQGMVYLVCQVYWFNPLVWIAAANSRREREIACDDYVLSGGTAGTAYADQLLDIARSLRTPRISGVSTIAMARQSELEGRLMAILNSDRHRGANTKIGMFATIGLLTAVVVPLAALRPVPVEPEPTLPPQDEPVVTVEPLPRPVPTHDITGDLALSIETEKYLAQVNEIVEKAARTLESLERLDSTVLAWQVDFGGAGNAIPTSILGKVIANPDTIPLAQIRRLEAVGVDVEYIEELATAGLDHMTVDQLVSLAHANIDGDFVNSMLDAGYHDLKPDELARLGFANVDPDDIAIWGEMGHDDLSTGELIRFAYADIDAEFILSMRSMGYTSLTPNDLIRLSHADVDAEFVQELRDLGFDVDDVDEVVRIKYMKIDPEYIQRVRKALEDN